MIDQVWIVCVVLLIVGFFNLGLFLAVLRSRGRREPFLSGTLTDLLNPWKKENEALERLHQQVAQLSTENARESEDG